MTPNPLMSRDEAAALLGIKPNSVRDTLRRRAGIEHVEGYPRGAVETFAKTYTPRAGQGRRTDLENYPDKDLADELVADAGAGLREHQPRDDTNRIDPYAREA